MGETSAAAPGLPSPAVAEAAAGAPGRQRSRGLVRIAAALQGGVTRLVDLAESGALRARLPRGGPGLEAVLVNTAGGMACGDHFAIAVETGAGARLTLATPAAEKVYRSDGPLARVEVSLAAADQARLHWLPQETILYDRARLARRYAVELAPRAVFLSFEALVLGRLAYGDAMAEGHVEDHWRIRRGGALVYADALRLSGSVAALLDRPAVAAGHRVLATLLYIAPDAEARLEEVRALLAEAEGECGASAWNGILAARFLAREAGALRRAAAPVLLALRGAALPRVWGT